MVEAETVSIAIALVVHAKLQSWGKVMDGGGAHTHAASIPGRWKLDLSGLLVCVIARHEYVCVCFVCGVLMASHVSLCLFLVFRSR